MRLDKYLAQASGASRKIVKQWIKAGQVSVDDVCIKNGGFSVGLQCKVSRQGEPLLLQGKRYIMLHKPVDTVSTAAHADSRSVLTLLPAGVRRGLHIVGRLDVDTTGLLLLSDDGQWSHRVTSPKRECLKVYRVGLADKYSELDLQQLMAGVCLNGESGVLRARALNKIDDRRVDISLGEGRYHQVKRMFAAVGHHVESLHRWKIGELELDETLAPGEWRHLEITEYSSF